MKIWISKRTSILVTSTLAAMLFCGVAIPQVQLSTDELYRLGVEGYAAGNCMAVSRYWFAYLQRSPTGMPPGRLNSIEGVLDRCDKSPTRYAFSSVTYAGEIPTKAGRCDAYAEIAVAQNESAQLSSCGFSGTRWVADKSFHYNWCMSLGGGEFAKVGEADQERQTRDSLLKSCTGAKAHKPRGKGEKKP